MIEERGLDELGDVGAVAVDDVEEPEMSSTDTMSTLHQPVALPTLHLVLSNGTPSFEVDRVEVRVSGFSDAAARENMRWLLGRLRSIRKVRK